MKFLKWIQLLVLPVAAYLGVVLINESNLRQEYVRLVTEIPIEAEQKLSKGLPTEEVTRWAVDRRNDVKVLIRNKGNYVTKRWAEERNQKKYNNPIGPSYKSLFDKIKQEDQSAEEVNKKILAGSGMANASVTASVKRFKYWGIGILSLWLISIIAFVKHEKYNTWQRLGLESVRFAASLLGGTSGVWLAVNLSLLLHYSEYLEQFGYVGGIIGSIVLAFGLTTFVQRFILHEKPRTLISTKHHRPKPAVEHA